MATFEELCDLAQLGFDPEALRAKYREERDKRLRADGNEQDREVVRDFSRYVDDPYAARRERAPIVAALSDIIVAVSEKEENTSRCGGPGYGTRPRGDRTWPAQTRRQSFASNHLGQDRGRKIRCIFLVR